MLSYIKLYIDLVETADELTDEQAGRLLKALLRYASGHDVERLPGPEHLVFAMLKAQISRDNEAYDAVLQRNRTNGSKGGRPRKEKADESTAKAEEPEPAQAPFIQPAAKPAENASGKKIDVDGNWRTSSKARGATAQRIVDKILDRGLPCAGIRDLYDLVIMALEHRMDPDEIMRRAEYESMAGFAAGITTDCMKQSGGG